jgi:hypothetical protein
MSAFEILNQSDLSRLGRISSPNLSPSHEHPNSAVDAPDPGPFNKQLAVVLRLHLKYRERLDQKITSLDDNSTSSQAASVAALGIALRVLISMPAGLESFLSLRTEAALEALEAFHLVCYAANNAFAA